MANVSPNGTVLPYDPTIQSPTGLPKFTNDQSAQGYVDRATINPDAGIMDNTVWRRRAQDAIIKNVIYNPAASGQPGGWDEAKYGSWSALVARNQGSTVGMNQGDATAILSWLGSGYTPTSGDYLQNAIGAYIPPTSQDRVLDPAYETLTLQQEKLAQDASNSQAALDFSKYQFEANLQMDQLKAKAAAVKSATSGSSGGGGGGDSSGGLTASDMSAIALQNAKLAMDWQIASLQASTQMALADKQNAIEQLKLNAQVEYQNAQLQLSRDQFAYQQQKDAKDEQLQRASTMAQVIQNPNDLLAREYMIRGSEAGGGAAPTGHAQDIFTGQSMGDATQPDLAATNAQNAGFDVFSGGGGGVTPQVAIQTPAGGSPAPPPPDPTAPPPPATPAGFARGTLPASLKRSKRLSYHAIGTNGSNKPAQYGHTKEKFFIVGDAPDGKPTGNEELIINHDEGRVTVIPNRHISAALKGLTRG